MTVGVEPLVGGGEGGGGEGTTVNASIDFAGDEFGALEDAKMFGDRW